MSLPQTPAHAQLPLEQEPNEDVESAFALPAGELGVEGVILGPLPVDTVLGAFATDCAPELGGCTASRVGDDQSYPAVGDSRASALFDVPVNPDGTARLRVSGSTGGMPDVEFMGAHGESGSVALYVRFYGETDTPLGTAVQGGGLEPGEVLSYVFAAPGGAIRFDALIDNRPPSLDRIDFLRFQGLPPHGNFTARVRSDVLDVALGLFGADGALIADAVDPDAAPPFEAELSGTVSAGGTATLAVTEFYDLFFEGDHRDGGADRRYTLEISPPVAVPALAGQWLALGAALLLGLALALGSPRTGRQRRRSGGRPASECGLDL